MYGWDIRSGRARKVFVGVAAAALLGGGLAVGTGLGNAGENCDGLDTALRNNLTFIAEQRANPDALSNDRIANRQAVVDLIEQRRAAAGCTADVGVGAPVATPAPEQPDGTGDAAAPDTGAPGEVVCAGSTVTLFNEDAAPAASSGTFPVGTVLKVTNLDNDRSITVTVTSPSGSCVLLNDAAFEQIREPGKFVIRRVVVERIS
ncbi:hypothetical protein O7621_19675 [Solwaraspora sp. WMMD937]|uniref:hypothetical protein n=1 Tax=Solwaraspora sp. WMMD937 TaxID=3016090 RepID=UPI00249BB33E|nr:hypothetical protein [Solwaraspora sp. WMMD937]WFE20113.1 hypothetical protein O7621_19675 [Solwaraspora sp. WMMD937]